LRTMKFLVTGVNGQLGYDVMNELAQRNIEAIGCGTSPAYKGIRTGASVESMPYEQLDITDRPRVLSLLESCHPDAVIHCAAWTAVDAAEEPENIPKVRAVNVDGTRYLAEGCKAIGAKMLYISTDYVFNGEGTEPWDPDCKNFAPLNVYGQSKLDGELAVSALLEKYFVVRIAWVFGLNGNNFVKTMLKVGKTHDRLRVVNDQVGTPTYTADLSRLLVDMIQTEKYGYYHATNEGGYISWYDFAREIFKIAGYPTTVIPVSTEEYGLSRAKRPFNSRLNKTKLRKQGFKLLPDWKDALNRYMKLLDEERLK
jgi:dTDP-4-dehydrorhamnose reductase